MTEMENLLTTVAEECGEIIQAVSKFLRFGAANHAPYDSTSNEDALITEYYQLVAVVEELQERGILPIPPKEKQEEIKNSKIENIKKFLDYSRQIGLIYSTQGEQHPEENTSRKKTWFTDMDGTIMCNKKGCASPKGLVPVAQKNGKHASYMTPHAFTTLKKITRMLECVPITTRCMESYKNIFIGSSFSHALVENGAILIKWEKSNCGIIWNIDHDWLQESMDIVSEDKKTFLKAKALLLTCGYVEKWQNVQFTLDFVQMENCGDKTSPKEMAEILKREGCGDVLLIVPGNSGICCTYKKLSKGEAIKRYCKKFGSYPLISSGDREEDNSMFGHTFYSVGTQDTDAMIKVPEDLPVSQCEKIVDDVLKITENILKMDQALDVI